MGFAVSLEADSFCICVPQEMGQSSDATRKHQSKAELMHFVRQLYFHYLNFKILMVLQQARPLVQRLDPHTLRIRIKDDLNIAFIQP